MKLVRDLAAVASLALVAACATHGDRPSEPERASGLRSGLTATLAPRHMVAAANPLAAEAGRDILRAGGSAIDAAIAMQMMLTLVEPQSSGIGGGAFLLHASPRRLQAYDGRETAPRAADEELFIADGKPMRFYDAAVGGRAVGVPGVLRMLELAHRQHGRLPWAQLFEPAIRLAEQGFSLSPRLHAQLVAEKYLAGDPDARAYFYDAAGVPKPIGTVLRNPALAATLRAIAEGGAEAFYRGPIADDIVTAVRTHRNAGRMVAGDLAGYRPRERDPLCSDYKRWRICGMPPPSSGGIAVAQMLGILSHHDLAGARPAELAGQLQPSVESIHLLSEAGRLAFADRNRFVADPDFVDLDPQALLAPDYLRARAGLIGPRSMDRALPGTPPGVRAAYAPDESLRIATSHLSAADGFGNVVSMTTSIEDVFGSRVMVRGFLLNNQLTDFSFSPAENGLPVANRVQSGKRPRSSMAPTLLLDRTSGAVVASLGSPGGSLIIGYVAKALVGMLDWELDIQQAIDLPNFGSRNGPTEIEQGRFTAETVEQLKARGHEVRELPMTSGLQGLVRVRRPDGRLAWSGGADPRREGMALGD